MANPTFSRVGTSNTYDNAQRNLMTRQGTLSNLQENLTSGKRVVRASDDPIASAQAERALTRISRIQTDQRALETQRNAITMAEGALGEITDAMQTFREQVVSAGNASLSKADRATIAQALSGLRDQIFALANRKDTNGQPLFGALGSAATPFSQPSAGTTTYTFNGLPGQAPSNDVSIAFALDGQSAFMLQGSRDGAYNVGITPTNANLKSGVVNVSDPALATASGYSMTFTAVDSTTTPGSTTATYDLTESPSGTVSTQTVTYPTSASSTVAITGMAGLSLSLTGTVAVGNTVSVSASQSLFAVLDTAIASIRDAENSNGAIQAVSQALNNVDIGMARVSSVRGQAGDLLNRADRITDNQDKRAIQMEADRSRAEDLDMVKGISDFQNQQTGYQAALQSYAQIQKLSLFNFIS